MNCLHFLPPHFHLSLIISSHCSMVSSHHHFSETVPNKDTKYLIIRLNGTISLLILTSLWHISGHLLPSENFLILWFLRIWQPTPVFSGKCHRQRSLAGYSPQGGKVRHDSATKLPSLPQDHTGSPLFLPDP